MKKLLFLINICFITNIITAQSGEVNSSGRNSYFWITLKAGAGSALETDSDLILTNGYRSVNLSSPDLSCTRIENDSSWIYQIKWTGNNFNAESESQTLEFNVVVNAYENANYTYVENDATVSSLGTDAELTYTDNGWSVGGDININAGESIKMVQQDFTIDGVDLFDSGLQLKNNFSDITLIETLGSFNHQVIFGEGENLATQNFKFTTETFDLSGDSFSVTGAGSQVEGKHFAIDEIKMELVVRNLELTEEDPDNPFSDSEYGYSFDDDAVALMNHLTELEKEVRPWSWDTPKRWAEIRKTTGPFTEEEIDIICQAADLAGDATFAEYYPDILYNQGYMNLEKDTRGAGFTGHFVEAPEHYLYQADGTVLYGGIENAWFNLANPDTREWWLDYAADLLEGHENEGCSFFTDALAKVGQVAGGDYYDYWGNPVSGDSYWDAAGELMAEVRDRFGDKFFIAGNFARAGTGDIRTQFTMDYLHIAYIESFENFGDYVPHVNEGIALMQELSSAGKWIQITVNDLKPNPSTELTLDEMRAKAEAAMPEIWAEYTEEERDDLAGLYAYFPFKLAMFLIGAGERSYFKYTGEKVVRTSGRDLFKNIMPFPEWDMALGSPLENGINNSNVWWRRFEHLDVVVNLNDGTSAFIHRQTGNGNNLALNGTATQSSTASRGEASLAIDGNANGSFSYGSVTSTNTENNPWWKLDLGSDATITDINILGRIDENFPNGLSNYTLSITDSSGETTFSQTFESFPSAAIATGGIIGNTISITIEGTGSIALAEVEVYGDAGNTTTNNIVTLRKSNAPDFAIDGNHGGENGQDVYLWSANDNNINQRWVEIDRGDGYYSYQKEDTNFCIDGNNGGENTQNVYLWKCAANNQNQHWQKVAVGDGSYRLIKRNATGFAINGGNGGANGQNVNLWNSSHTSTNLNWFITTVGTAAKDSNLNKTSMIDEVMLYPNPVSNILNIQGAENSTVQIFDVNGKLVYSKVIANKNETIDVSNLQTGLYFTKFQNSNKIIKLIKK